jgi:uncharacterized protein (TIGR00251 family)
MSKLDLTKYIKNKILEIHVIPNAKQNTIYYDEERKCLMARLKAQPRDNNANTELIVFIKKEYLLKCSIIKGLKSRDKVLLIE